LLALEGVERCGGSIERRQGRRVPAAVITTPCEPSWPAASIALRQNDSTPA